MGALRWGRSKRSRTKAAGMIHFITTARHDYTTAALGPAFGAKLPEVKALSYADLWTAERADPGAYVFCDIERLSDDELLLAEDLFRCIAGAPHCLALNDPAKVQVRYGLLRRLKEGGINDFDAYPADGCPKPAQFPVFVRRRADHDAALSGLLKDQEELERRLAELETSGESLRALVVIEFCAESISPGLYRRYGMFRIGDRMHLDHIVTEDSWNVKYGKKGLVDDEIYRADDLAIRENRYADTLFRGFELGGIDYGRADFGLVRGRPQIYEINTNPYLGTLAPHPSEVRTASTVFAHRRFAELLFDIDRPVTGGKVRLDTRRLAKRRREGAEELLHLQKRLDRAVEAQRKAEAELRAVTESTSWRATGPLRRGIAALRQRFRPAPATPGIPQQDRTTP